MDFRRPHHPHNNRRAAFHNYRGPGAYMISINKEPAVPPFCTLIGNPYDPERFPPGVLPSSVGRIIDSQIKAIDKDPLFGIPNSIIMPDHIHILWVVKQWLPRKLGYYVGLFKSRCSHEWNLSRGNAEGASLFLPKFNDRISFTEDMFRRMSHYISDNPRRRLIVRLYPHLFDRRQRVRILDREMDVYGNFQLLKHPVISAILISSRYTPEQRESLEREWAETIRSQGVLVSPFISRAEREVMNRAITQGASIIRIIPDGLGPKYKPSGQEFELCAAGRCLHIGEARLSGHTPGLRRAECLRLNDMARWIASHPADTMVLLSKA